MANTSALDDTDETGDDIPKLAAARIRSISTCCWTP
jgi:hypothetical protein